MLLSGKGLDQIGVSGSCSLRNCRELIQSINLIEFRKLDFNSYIVE